MLSLQREKYMNCISIFIQSLNDLFTCIVGEKKSLRIFRMTTELSVLSLDGHP